MFDKIPFSVYDFFGYLASGFLLLIGLSYCKFGCILSTSRFNVISWVLVTIIAYILGHILSSICKWIFAFGLFKAIYPQDYLFSACEQNNPLNPEIDQNKRNIFAFLEKWIKSIKSEYNAPFDEPICRKIKENLKIDEQELKGKALFDYAYSKARLSKEVIARADIFLGLYGFCRTISLTLLLLSFAFLAGWIFPDLYGDPFLILSAFIASLIMLLRYRKFLRQYQYEIFLTCLVPPEKKVSNKSSDA